MNGNTFYSAASSNFLGTELVFQRHGLNPLKTEMLLSWFNEPTMISLCLVEASKNSEDGIDDFVVLFFTENAVSRIARVCKSDMGGQRTLQGKWTSFLKVRLDCPFGNVGSTSLVQDAFLLQDQKDWRDSIFYATFTINSESSGACSQSAVCAYKLSDISRVFSGRFLTESDTGSWDRYTGEEPFPHPGSCINDELRAEGVMTSLDFSDKTLLFVKNHPLMEGAVTPITGKPLLVRIGTLFSKIVVDQVTSLDGQLHQVMFIGTESGWLQKAVRFDGEEGRVIEELQVFQTPQPVNFLQLSSKTGQLYGGANGVAVQVNVRDCSRYTSCDDCLLARDPYCGWDMISGQCVSVVGAFLKSIIQSLTDGDLQKCPISDLETVKGKVHRKTVVQYFVQVQDPSTLVRTLKAAVIVLSCLLILLICSVLVIRRIQAKKQNHIGCGNENKNNNHMIVSPFFHYDPTPDRLCDQEEEQSVETRCVKAILILPEVTLVNLEVEVEADTVNGCTVIEISG
ncbi:hypothetical protein JOQ06_028752 [Pogonophryne albipinna]|uniref:Sema domain-containing protein n=1 Tax=Pogonophryne albipinna TaxID=1090488 RepID=A0AAD6B9J6_9TELE|nr:hypothetical protein JOQ06_028752 [Pogonophryne albipinna]